MTECLEIVEYLQLHFYSARQNYPDTSMGAPGQKQPGNIVNELQLKLLQCRIVCCEGISIGQEKFPVRITLNDYARDGGPGEV